MSYPERSPNQSEFSFDGAVVTSPSHITSERNSLHPGTTWTSKQIGGGESHFIHITPTQPIYPPDSVGSILGAHDEEDVVTHNIYLSGYSVFQNPSTSTRVPSSSESRIQPLFDSSDLFEPTFDASVSSGHESIAHDSGFPATRHANYPMTQQHIAQHMSEGNNTQNALSESKGGVRLFQNTASAGDLYVSSAPVAHPLNAVLPLPERPGPRTGAWSLYDTAQASSPHNVGVSQRGLVISDVASLSESSPSSVSGSGVHRASPNASDKKRSVEVEYDGPSCERRVLARRGRASSVWSSTSFDQHKRPSSRNNTDNAVVPGRGPRIPQFRYTVGGIHSFDHSEEQHATISFNLEGAREVGIRITDVLNGDLGRLEDRLGLVEAMEKSTVSLRFHWPGYPLWTKAVASRDWKKSRSPLTRENLARTVARAVQQFFKAHRNERVDSDYAAWSVGPRGIQLSEVALVALRHVSQGSWQPELCLSNPRPETGV